MGKGDGRKCDLKNPQFSCAEKLTYCNIAL